VDGYRNIVSREYREFPSQNHWIPLAFSSHLSAL
jgi:hypothetical protein